MPASRLGGTEMFLHGEPPPPRLVTHFLAREKFIERDRPHLGPDTAGRTEIRYSTLGRDAGAGEWHDRGRFLDKVAQPGNAGLQIGRDHSGFLPTQHIESIRPPPSTSAMLI